MSLATPLPKISLDVVICPLGAKSPPLGATEQEELKILSLYQSLHSLQEPDLWNSLILRLMCDSGLTSYPESYLIQTGKFFYSEILSSYS